MLTGGGAQLHGLTEYLSEELKVEVTVSPDPVNCVALGTAMSLGLNDKLETGFWMQRPALAADNQKLHHLIHESEQKRPKRKNIYFC